MKRSLLVACAMLAMAGAAQAESGRLVTVVTSAEPQTQLMAMVLSMQAVQQGADVHMLLCGPGGDLALREAPLTVTVTAAQPPQGASPQALMQAIMKQGGTVQVCAIYRPGRGEGPEVLLEGVGVASPPDMAAAMLAEEARVWTF